MKKKSIILITVIFAIVVAIFLLEKPLSKPQVYDSQRGRQIGQFVLDFEFEDRNGKKVSFDDFRGKSALLINAWAVWCPLCIHEMPDLQKVSDEFGNDVKVIFVHRSSTEDKEKALTFLNNLEKDDGIKITDPVLFDSEDEFYRVLLNIGMPATLFVDKEGIIRDRKIGAMAQDEIRQRMEGLLTYDK